jgi:hypothetical protein
MNILYAIKIMNANWIGHVLCRNWLVKHIRRKDTGKDTSDGKTRKKTSTASGWP